MTLERLAVGLVGALLLVAPAFAEESTEVDVSNDPAVRDGEPSLGANPTDSSNLVIGFLKTFPGEGATADGGFLARGGRCAVSATRDGGLTWTTQLLPFTDLVYPICADPTVVFSRAGVVAMAAIAFNATFQIGHTMVTRSTDGGLIWSAPVEAVGPGSLAAGVGEGTTAPIDGFDRPWLAFDAAGRLYLTTMTIFSRPMGPLAHRYLAVSEDGGQTWERPRMVDSPEYPADHWATGTIAVGADGTVAVAYTARQVPEAGVRCPCAVLATTSDGVVFTRRTVPFSGVLLGINVPDEGPASALRLAYGPVVAADPTQAGRFAVAGAVWEGLVPFTLGQLGVVEPNRVQVELSRTDDSGASWSGPTTLGEAAAKDREHVWIATSPAGALGAVWRTHAGACCFGATEVWSVVSPDGGVTFDPPRKMSHAASPFTEGLGDDYQSVAVDGSFVHAAWADGRSGDEEIFYARLPLAGP